MYLSTKNAARCGIFRTPRLERPPTETDASGLRQHGYYDLQLQESGATLAPRAV